MPNPAHIDAVIDEAIAGNRIVGTVVMVYEDGQSTYSRAAGFSDREAGTPMREDAIFRLASVSKPIVAATALALIERGGLGYEDAVADHLPYFTPRTADGHLPTITVKHLLTHTSGLGYSYADPMLTGGLTNTDLDFEANFTRLARQPLAFAPGTAWQYSMAIDVLGAVIAKREGTTLEKAVERYVTGPLGMADTAFHATDPARLATHYGDGAPPVRMSDPHTVTHENGETTTFSPSRIFNPRAFQSGGAGMAGSAGDLIKFLEAIRTGGGGILSDETIRQAMSNQIGDLPRDDAGMRFGLIGAVLDDPEAAGWSAAPGTVNWGGIYGHSWFIDPANRISVISMTNTAVEGCTGRYPDDIREAVYGRLPNRA